MLLAGVRGASLERFVDGESRWTDDGEGNPY